MQLLISINHLPRRSQRVFTETTKSLCKTEAFLAPSGEYVKYAHRPVQLCIIFHRAENKEIVLLVSFQPSLILKPCPKPPQLPPHKPPPPPSSPQRATTTPCPKIPYPSDPSAPQRPHPHPNLSPPFTEPHPPTALAARVEGEEVADAVAVAVSVAGY